MKDLYEAGEGVTHKGCNNHDELVIIIYNDREEIGGFCMRCNTKVTSTDIEISNQVFHTIGSRITDDTKCLREDARILGLPERAFTKWLYTNYYLHQ